MREEQLIAGDAHVDAAALATLEQLENGIGASGMAEDGREDVAEAGGYRDEARVTANGGDGRRALRRIAADTDEVAEFRRAGRRPAPQALEVVERLEVGLPPSPSQQATEPPRYLPRRAGAGARRDDDLHRARRYGPIAHAKRFLKYESFFAILPLANVKTSQPLTSSFLPSAVVPVNAHSDRPRSPATKWRASPKCASGNILNTRAKAS